jgi:DNA primase large subunit
VFDRILKAGFVQLTKDEATRLLEEEIQSRILSRMEDTADEEQDFPAANSF